MRKQGNGILHHNGRMNVMKPGLVSFTITEHYFQHSIEGWAGQLNMKSNSTPCELKHFITSSGSVAAYHSPLHVEKIEKVRLLEKAKFYGSKEKCIWEERMSKLINSSKDTHEFISTL